jgi:hypothetical protein
MPDVHPAPPPTAPSRPRKLLWIVAVAALVAAIGVTAFLLVRDVQDFGASGALAPQHHPRDLLRRPPFQRPDATRIQSWMTFEYLDRVFGMPPDYLKDALDVADARYPRVSIRRYARDAKIDEAAALARVKRAVTEFLGQAPSSGAGQ